MPTVLILDGELSRRQHLVELITRIDAQIRVETFVKAEAALAWLRWHTADLVVSDSQFTDIRATSIIHSIRQLPDCHDLPVVMLTPCNDLECRREVLQAGATDLLTTPLDDLEFGVRCKNLLTSRSQQKVIHQRARWLERRVSEATGEIRRREHETLLRLAKAGEYRDEDTGNHVLRMAKYARLIAEQLGLSKNDCDAIEMAAPLHDIGKIGIPDDILRKPGRLSHAEFEIMKQHTLIGYDILKESPSKYLQTGAIIALSHHEKFNGTGYPHQLGGHEIPLVARIVSVADAYDALTSERPYKKEWSVQKSIDYITEQRSKYFDPECVDAFIIQLENAIRIRQSLTDKPRKSANHH
ncbi:Response regulator [hydrothermal vent metagenome]|uniref:Response regulator n=1 Tax=hydrothermal vent metagenome TaxID=652676 RepID=A0A3B0Z706_9ZZZZ